MKRLVDSHLAKKIDEITVNTIGIPSIVLMEHAALAVCDNIVDDVPMKSRILAVCGKGNNGADGIAVARLLHDRGYNVHIFFVGANQQETITDEAKLQYDIACKLNIPFVSTISDNQYDVIIDGLFGVGLSRDIEGKYIDIINSINYSGAKIYAVDIPSGVCADDGRVCSVCVRADVTVTFGLNKLGLVLYPGCEYAGRVIVNNRVFPEKVYDMIDSNVSMPEPEDINLIPARVPVSNKGTYGHVLVIAGSSTMCGAAYLAAKAAYRTGCGLVKILTHENNRQALCSLLPEAIIDTYNEYTVFDEDYLKQYDDWADAIVVGPGLGMCSCSYNIMECVLKYMKTAKIIDADGLNIIASCTDLQEDKNWWGSSVLTPHLKEMSRLTGEKLSACEIHNNIIETAVDYCKNDSVLVLKDARTVTAYNGKICVNTSGNDGMATAGSGDVLTGIIASLVAQGMKRYEAAMLGVYIHGLAGDSALKYTNRYSMIAEDIIEGLVSVLNNHI